jgi:predicted PurR-regulated permease PerM
MKFKIYVGIMLFICTVASVVTAVALVYGEVKLKDQTQTVTNKVNSFTTQVDGINKNLQNINQNLQSANTQIQKQASLIPTSIRGL